MTKSELLTELGTKFYKVLNPTMHQEEGGLRWYTVKVYDRIGDAIRDSNIPFYVENEGEINEIAYWSPSEPKPDPVSGFQQEIDIYIAGKITGGTIEGAFAETVDQINETAIYKVVMPDLTERRLFVDKDANGDLRHRQMV